MHSALPYCLAYLVEQLSWLLFHADLQEAGFVQDMDLCYTVNIINGSAKRPCGGHYTEGFWNVQVIGAFAEPFFIIT